MLDAQQERLASSLSLGIEVLSCNFLSRMRWVRLTLKNLDHQLLNGYCSDIMLPTLPFLALLGFSHIAPSDDVRLPKVFEERIGSSITAAAWIQNWNGGRVQDNKGLGTLLPGSDTTQFPYFLTTAFVLPEFGDWNLEVDFAVQEIGTHGCGLSLMNLSSNTQMFRIHVDQSLNGVQVWGGDEDFTFMSGQPLSTKPQTFKARLKGPSFRYRVEKRGNTFSLGLDGTFLTIVNPKNKKFSLRIGTDKNEKTPPGGWSRISFGPIRVEYLSGNAPNWLRAHE
jgi:hypothetical protein